MENERKSCFWPGSSFSGLVVVAAGALLLGPMMMAQDGGSGARAVRLSSVDGQVQLSQGNTVLASQAVANTPLFEGTQITTSDDGRAEVQFEDGSVARVSPSSSLTLSVLRQQGSSTDTELVLDSGLGYFELQGETPNNHIRVRFGGGEVTSSGFSVLRIDLDNPPGELAVFSGNAHLENGNSLALDLHGGESVKLNGADSGNYALSEAIEPNSWDAWNSDRDQALTSQEADRTAATNAVPNSNNPAWSDLDSNGNWYNVPGQGYVWSPYQAQNPGWDPYGCGSWNWTPRFNYMWVSCEPWGYLPYQSGMWNFYDGFGWGWEPGFGGPWWGGGGGWAFNVGVVPARYQPPNRPRGGPVKPGSPIRAGGRYQPYPVVGVNRLGNRPTGAPVRVRNAPVVLAGNPVAPLRPLAPRQTYGRAPSTGMNRPSVSNPGAGGGVRYGYVQSPNTSAGSRQGYGVVSRPSGGPSHAPAYYGGYNAGPPASSGRPSAPSRGYSGGGGSAMHSSGGGASHSGGVSSGGGGASHGGGFGGGGAAPSAGGGGGASHGGGGGGGSHH